MKYLFSLLCLLGTAVIYADKEEGPGNKLTDRQKRVEILCKELDASDDPLLTKEQLSQPQRDSHKVTAKISFRSKGDKSGLRYGVNLWLLKDTAELRHQWYYLESSDKRLLINLIMLSDFEYEFSDYRDGFLRDLLVSKRYDISERAARVEEFRAAVEGLPIFSKWLIDHVSDRQKISDSIKVIESRSSYCGKIDTWMNDHGSSFVMQYEEGEKHLKQENGSSQ